MAAPGTHPVPPTQPIAHATQPERCPAQVTLHPSAPVSLPELHFLGAERSLAPLRRALNANLRLWDHSRRVRLNLQALLGAELPSANAAVRAAISRATASRPGPRLRAPLRALGASARPDTEPSLGRAAHAPQRASSPFLHMGAAFCRARGCRRPPTRMTTRSSAPSATSTSWREQCPTWRATAAPSPSTASASRSGCRGCQPLSSRSTACLASASTAPSPSPSKRGERRRQQAGGEALLERTRAYLCFGWCAVGRAPVSRVPVPGPDSH